MAKKAKASKVSDLQRYLFIGAGFGFYFGWFLALPREPSIAVAILRAIVITIVLFLFRLYQQGRAEIQGILRGMPLSFAQALIFFVVLESRHVIYDFGFGITETHLGGRAATAFVLVIVGMLLGSLYHWQNSKK